MNGFQQLFVPGVVAVAAAVDAELSQSIIAALQPSSLGECGIVERLLLLDIDLSFSFTRCAIQLSLSRNLCFPVAQMPSHKTRPQKHLKLRNATAMHSAQQQQQRQQQPQTDEHASGSLSKPQVRMSSDRTI